MTLLLSEFIVWFACIFGVFGSTGRKREEKRGECPCHGSMYDPLTGMAFAGPASLQSPPSNVLAKLDLEVDNDGNIWIKPPNWSVNGNGIVGFGRFIT